MSRSIRSSSTASRATRSSTSPTALHPTAEGVEAIVQKILPSVEALLKQVKQ